MALLDIKETDRTESVIIDGEEYSLTSFDDFSPSDQFRLKKIGARISALAEKDDPTDKEIAEVETASDQLFQKVAGDIPEEVRAKLKPGAKQRIVTAFFLALVADMGQEKDSAELRSPNGPKTQSPGSSDSTEETPSTG